MNLFVKIIILVIFFVKCASSENDSVTKIILGNVSVSKNIPIDDSLVMTILYFKLTNSFNIIKYDPKHGICAECKKLKVPILKFDDVLRFLCKKGICHFIAVEFRAYTISGIRPDLEWNKKNSNMISGRALNEFFSESYFTMDLNLYSSSIDSTNELKSVCIRDTVMLDNNNPDFLGYIGLLCTSAIDSLHKIIYKN